MKNLCVVQIYNLNIIDNVEKNPSKNLIHKTEADNLKNR